jgi:predicted transcriptional regulator of viral defense system
MALLRRHGGLLRTRDALRLGVHPRTLYALRDGGALEQVARGLYRLADLPPLGNPDLVAVALKVPKGVVCLLSALSLHELTTQVPHEVYVALPRGAEPPRLAHPPVRVFWFSGSAFTAGVEERKIDGVPVRVYGAEKTIADCFKYRNKIGVAVAVEALNRFRRRKGFNVDRLMEAARACRVERVMRPYVEAIL